MSGTSNRNFVRAMWRRLKKTRRLVGAQSGSPHYQPKKLKAISIFHFGRGEGVGDFKFSKSSPELTFTFTGRGGGWGGGWWQQIFKRKVNLKFSKSSPELKFPLGGGGGDNQLLYWKLPLHWVGLAINMWFPYTSVWGTTTVYEYLVIYGTIFGHTSDFFLSISVKL